MTSFIPPWYWKSCGTSHYTTKSNVLPTVTGEPYIKPMIIVHGFAVETFTYVRSTLTSDGSLDVESFAPEVRNLYIQKVSPVTRLWVPVSDRSS